MGRIPPIVTIIVGVLLIVGIIVGVLFVLIKPQQEELAQLQSKLEAETQEAAQLESVQEELLKATKLWNTYRRKLDKLQDDRSIPVSFTQPITAWITLWPEYRKTLPELIEEFVQSSGCTIVSGASFPAPPSEPPQAPSSGFLEIPEAGIDLVVEGELSAIEKLYKSLRKFPRVAVISDLSLSSYGDTITAQVPLRFYLYCEVPEGAVPPAGGMGVGFGAPGQGMMPDRERMGQPGGVGPPERERAGAGGAPGAGGTPMGPR